MAASALVRNGADAIIGSMKWYLTAVGCRLNQAEMETVSRELLARGERLVRNPADADWAIINTCAVTHVAVRKCRQMIRRLHRRNPRLQIAITGCGTELPSEELARLDGVVRVIKNGDKHLLLDHLGDVVPVREIVRGASARLATGHTRAFVKVQDGCDNACAYCFVTIARGAQRSRAPEDVLNSVNMRLAEGYREVVLTGVHIGAYGRDSAPGAPLPPARGWTLARLVDKILTETEVPRLRLSSIEPWDVTPDLLRLWDDPRLCRQVHLPLQSGSDSVLRRMGRRYDQSGYLRLVEEIRRSVPDVSITTDIMVGFPGETDADLCHTVDTAKRAGFARLHVFKYSARPRTRAAAMADQVDPRIADARSRRIIALGEELAASFHQQFVGRDVSVLFEQEQTRDGDLVWSGLTDNYLRVVVPSTRDLRNVIAPVHCLRADSRELQGVLLQNRPTPALQGASESSANRSSSRYREE